VKRKGQKGTKFGSMRRRTLIGIGVGIGLSIIAVGSYFYLTSPQQQQPNNV